MLIEEKNYIMIQGWMRTKLNLSGNDLLVYAIIYGFSQVEGHSFNGSLQYLADWCGATKQGIQKNLKSLLEKGLINKITVEKNGIKMCEYSCILYNIVAYPIQHSCMNNIDNNIDNNTITINSNSIAKNQTSENFIGSVNNKKKPNLYDKCVSLIKDFTDDNILQEYLVNFLKNCLENSKESGTPFYTNTFKGKLNKLKSLSEDDYEQRKIVMQTLDNGWNGFYEIKDNKRTKNVHNDLNESGAEFVPTVNKKAVKESIRNGQGEKF